MGLDLKHDPKNVTKTAPGVDIASGEMHFEEDSMKSSHQLAMQLAKKAELGVTVHAAESGPGPHPVDWSWYVM